MIIANVISFVFVPRPPLIDLLHQHSDVVEDLILEKFINDKEYGKRKYVTRYSDHPV